MTDAPRARTAPAVLTAKGARQADAILDAAVRCLARDGYSGSSLQRIADEAGVQKRMVVYYFGSRTGLVEAVVQRIGERFFGQAEEALRGLNDPAAILTTGLDRVWELLIDDQALQVAYFGLVAESITDPAIRRGLQRLRDRGRALASSLIDDLEDAGYELLIDRDSLLILLGVAVHGFGLELLERGDSPELQRVIGLAELALQFMVEHREHPAD
jgi:AcrR family transcriptional regulator